MQATRPATLQLLPFCALLALTAAPVCLASPVHLRCNYQDQPLGIDTPKPSLSWQNDSLEKGWKQSAYRILVATSAERALAGHADVWDSGKQASSTSVDISYAGPPLESRHRYFWAVQVWDAAGRLTSARQSAWWEMGLLHATDWTAQWTGAADNRKQEAAALPWIWLAGENAMDTAPNTVATFRYNLTLNAAPLRATLAVAARGNFHTSINGHQTGLKKDWNAFDQENIGDLLHAGNNEVLVEVTAPSVRVRQGEPPLKTVVAGLAAMLQLTSSDGTDRTITTAHQWEAKSSAADWKLAQFAAKLDDPRMGADPGLPSHPAILLRNEFQAKQAVVRARLYVTAAGSYRMSLNGQRVDANALTPDFTDYRKRISYQTYDVTGLIRRGANAIGAILGDGWYSSPMLWNGSHLFPGPVRLLAQLELQYADGTTATVATSPDWKVSNSPVLSSTIYGGETYDARLEQPGWDTPGFHDAKWIQASALSAPETMLSAQIGRPVHQTQTLQPKSVRQLDNGDSVFDMGQNMVGWVTLRASGSAGKTARLRFAERLNPDGTIYTENLRNADAEDTYTFRGNTPEVFAPHFTFHGFRYVQVTGLAAKPALATLQGDVMSSLDSQPTGRLETSSKLLNRMWELGIWGQRGNFLSIPTDCPQRDERMGWMGDAGVFWRTGSYNFDIAAFSHKFMQDIVDARSAAGAFSDISPNLLSAAPGAPGWGDAGIIVPYETWRQYGDRSLIDQNWAAMERWIDFIEHANPNYLRQKSLGANYGDWLAPDPATPKDLAATAYWAIIVRMMREMAQATGKDEGKYAGLYDRIRESYSKAYIASDGKVEGDTQTGDLLTLYAGLAPAELRSAIADRLVANIQSHNGHLTTGFLGTPFLLYTLSENNKTATAYDLLFQETYPSWGYMIAKDATTWWERWNGDSGDPSMNSYNHYSFGSVVAWVYQDVVGIATDVAAPGSQHFIIKPHFTTKLSFVRGEYDSVYGTVKSRWTETSTGTYRLHIVLPANTTATVYPEGEAGRAVQIGAGASELIAQPGGNL